VRKRFLFIFLLGIVGTELRGQQDPQFTHYMFNTIYYNPAYAGVEGVTKLTAIHRSQWLGYQPSLGGGGAPTTQLVSFSTPVYKFKSGFGAYIVNDRLGPQNNLEAQASYAYHMPVKGGKLSLGLKAGLYSQTINFNLYRPIDQNDPVLRSSGKESQVRPDFSLGAFLQREKYYVGLSFNHLVKSSFDFGLSQRNALNGHGYLTAGYFYDINFPH
jgi:type IX secretion system PorP/SprF family membrane protein